MSIQIETVIANEVEMQYFRFGNGNRKMIMIPGFSVRSIMPAKDLIASGYEMFVKNYEVYVFDIRRNLPAQYSISDMADDLIRVLDALGLKNLYVYSISMGGMEAQLLSVRRPDLVKALILGSTTPGIFEETRGLFADWNRFSREKNEEGLLNSFAENVYSEEFLKEYGEAILSSCRNLTEDEFKRCEICTQALLNFEAVDDISEIACPTLVMQGKDDRVIGLKPAFEFAARLKCEPVFFPGFGHAVYDENPEFRVKALEFFDGVE